MNLYKKKVFFFFIFFKIKVKTDILLDIVKFNFNVLKLDFFLDKKKILSSNIFLSLIKIFNLKIENYVEKKINYNNKIYINLSEINFNKKNLESFSTLVYNLFLFYKDLNVPFFFFKINYFDRIDFLNKICFFLYLLIIIINIIYFNKLNSNIYLEIKRINLLHIFLFVLGEFIIIFIFLNSIIFTIKNFLLISQIISERINTINYIYFFVYDLIYSFYSSLKLKILIISVFFVENKDAFFLKNENICLYIL